MGWPGNSRRQGRRKERRVESGRNEGVDASIWVCVSLYGVDEEDAWCEASSEEEAALCESRSSGG